MVPVSHIYEVVRSQKTPALLGIFPEASSLSLARTGLMAIFEPVTLQGLGRPDELRLGAERSPELAGCVSFAASLPKSGHLDL